MKTIVFSLVFCASAAWAAEQPTITIDPRSKGRVFDGLGALSAGASSRLLPDYPEPQRSDILDFLFQPQFGASFHHFKVEIGGDINSTDGTEPSHARTRAEFLNPRREYFDRGYEWWLMNEAKKRNPAILLDALQWGAPPWIGDANPGLTEPDPRRFFSQDDADFIVSFIRGAQQYHGLAIDYCGGWNEMPYDKEWIKLLRHTLDRNGLRTVRIVAADQFEHKGVPLWGIVDDVVADPELARAVEIIGVHYPSRPDLIPLERRFTSPHKARQLRHPLWSSEDGSWRGDWEGARRLARIFNRNYAIGRMTKTIIWSLVSSYYDILPMPGSGPMRANTPWSGYYEVQPALWAIAHTTQFAQPGWRYLDDGCGLLPGGGSCVSLCSPESADYSIILETADAKAAQTLSVRVPDGWPRRRLSVWRSTEQSQFERQAPIEVNAGHFTLTLEPDAIYSLTTTYGQQKGQPKHPIPVAKELLLPYGEDFESTLVGKAPKYLSDLEGAFEVIERPDRNGRCLRQVVTSVGIPWTVVAKPSLPQTIIGSTTWTNYEVTCDVRPETNGWAAVGARFSKPFHTGYWLILHADGDWRFRSRDEVFAQGTLASPAGSSWHRLSVNCNRNQISATIDQQQVATVEDSTFKSGLAALGTGWNAALFDNLQITSAGASEPVSKSTRGDRSTNIPSR